MALFKCKMCGGDLEINGENSIAECEYCGTMQTVPKFVNENLSTLFNRANTLRFKSEFDKAEKVYEKIISVDSTQAEAYWGLILCKYGIEYVDDPVTFKKTPTCHRASYDSVIADEDYKSAIENADISQREVYEEQAREIDRIQKEILALAQKEERYDVFICYKETDIDGKRTQDSVIANDIYYQLTQEGFKVFYAAITLEGKLGSAYEPIIFAALNSAKVMLTIGTKPEYFNAVWVKNEWSRFLKIIKKDRSKLLIPCYRDMDAYELPDEFAHLQAQDMSKIGFINDLVRGIKKVVKKGELKQSTIVKEPVVTTANTPVAPLLKRAFMFLEDGDFTKADAFFEQILNQDPENAQAYLGKLMLELNVKKQESLKDCPVPFDNNNNYQKVIRFGDDALKNKLVSYNEYINNKRLNDIYKRAVELMEQSTKKAKEKIALYNEAIALFESIKDFKDADEKVAVCKNEIQINKARISKRRKKTAIIVSVVSGLIAFIIFFTTVILPPIFVATGNYKAAVALGATDIEIPDGVTSIGDYAFSWTGLTSITIPDSVTSIGDHAFECLYLTSITIPDSVTSIGDHAFAGTDLTSITIPDSVTSIGKKAFYYCWDLTSITIPDSVTSIGEDAFFCTFISKIEFKGTKAQWNAISSKQSLGINEGCTIYCTDGTLTQK